MQCNAIEYEALMHFHGTGKQNECFLLEPAVRLVNIIVSLLLS